MLLIVSTQQHCPSLPSSPTAPRPDSPEPGSAELPSSPPLPTRRRPQKEAPSTKASPAPRKRGQNLSSAQQQVFKTFFERGMTDGSRRTLGWREKVQATTGLSMQQVNVCTYYPYLYIKRRQVTNSICIAKNQKHEEGLQR